MNILHLNTLDIKGGAARAAYRLHKGLLNIGISSCMMVQTRKSFDNEIIGPQTSFGKQLASLRPTLDSLAVHLYKKRSNATFSPALLPENLRTKTKKVNPDIIHLHWLNGGFMRIETLKHFRKPLVWTLHDMWPFTGGCHYDEECGRYILSCGRCPMLGSTKEHDLSRLIYNRKYNAWKNLNLTIITPSRWLAKCVNKSSLFKNFRIEVIPNGLDLRCFRPFDKKMARDILLLPHDKKLVLFGAIFATSDNRKGFYLLQSALKELIQDNWDDSVELIIFGANRSAQINNSGLNSHCLGILHDDVSLALAYSAADVFVAPSVQDNFPNTVLESLACGTPCVAFNIGGMADMIDHKQNGYLARSFNTHDLANGITWVIENNNRHESLSRAARAKVENEFSLETIANKYLELYEEIV